MITIIIDKWIPIGGVTQLSVSYQVASDILFTNIIDDHPNDTVNVNAYYSPVVVPLGATYYVRVDRHFSNTTSSGWGDTIAVTNNIVNGGVLTYEPVMVSQPVVTVDDVSLHDPATLTYSISTNNFTGVNDGHGYTIWMVLSDSNEVIEFVKSTTALTAITFNKGNTKLLGTKFIKVLAIHGTLTNIESMPGSTTKLLSSTGFSISTNSNIVAPGIDVVVNITRNLSVANNTITRIALRDLNGNKLWDHSIYGNVISVVIPGALFDNNTHYMITGYGIPSTDINSYTIGVESKALDVIDNIDRNYIYGKTARIGATGQVFPIPTSLVTKEFFNSKIVVPVSSGMQYMLMNPDGSFTTSATLLNGIITLVNGGNDISIIPLTNDRLIIDYSNGVTTKITLYSLDYYNNIAILKNSLTISGQTTTVNNGIVTINNDLYYIGRNASTTLDEYTITQSTISIVTHPLPTNETSVSLICEDEGNSILLFCTGSSNVYSFDLDTKTYITKYDIPIQFRNRTLKKERLANGDVIIWRPMGSEVVNGTTVIDTQLDALYIDNTTGSMALITLMTGTNFNIPGSIMTNSGKLLLITDSIVGSNIITFE